MSCLAVWDFTLSVRRSTTDHVLIIEELEKIAKKWTFQLEKPEERDEDGNIIYHDIDDTDDESNNDDEEFGLSSSDSDLTESEISEYSDYFSDVDDEEYDSDNSTLSDDSQQGAYEHYQGRISLIKKKRKSELLRLLYENDFLLANGHWRPTTSICMGDIFYVTKADSRIAGPWTNNDAKPIPIPKQIKMIETLYPYQQEIIDRAKYCWNPRTIDLIYDPDGCKGKSTLATYCGVHDIGRRIPCMNNYMDLMQAVMCMPVSKLYFIDIPRALTSSKNYKDMTEYLGAIESIKDGWLWDKRYKFQEKYIDSPSLWCMSNKLLDTGLLSRDRWNIWTIKDNELFLYNNGDLKKGEPIIYPESESEEENDENDKNEGGTLESGSDEENEGGGIDSDEDGEIVDLTDEIFKLDEELECTTIHETSEVSEVV